ncbi:MAG TPA: hypothetical protein VK843_20810 [Planctomycetota bacterium]|nr:hypothetical protein [Planctomycetota bacterium]
MSKEHPDHHDADLILKLYDLRREAVMRQSRITIAAFLPRTWEDIAAIVAPAHLSNAAWRQVSSYWEMVYSFARHGVVNPDFLIENSAEGMFLFVKVHPYLERFRTEFAPTAFRNAEWIASQCETGRQRYAMIKTRVEKMMEAAK